jgi:hypothetical protein
MATYSGTCGTNVNWTLDTSTGVLAITGTGDMANYKSYSPSYAPWYSNRTYIKTVHIASGITRIGDCTFYKCKNLASVTISDNVTRIGLDAFFDCTALTSITIPDRVSLIETRAFRGCYGLTEITFLGELPTMETYAFLLGTSSSGSVTATIYSNGWASDNVFTTTIRGDYTTFIYKVPLPGGSCGTNAQWEFNPDTGELRIFGTGDMYGYDAPDTPMPSPWATYIDDITSIVIEEGITGLGNFAFSYTPITSITIPSTVTYIGNSTFEGCGSLTEIIFLGGQPEIWSRAFSLSPSRFHDPVIATIYSNGWASDDVFTTFIRGDYTTFIYETLAEPLPSGQCGDNAFWEFDPDTGTLRIYGSGAMTNYARWDGYNAPWDNIRSSIVNVIVENGITTIGDDTFCYCPSLSSVAISDTVTTIGSMAFRDAKLSEVVIPASVTAISSYTFNGCTELVKITFLGDKPSIGADAFVLGTSNKHVTTTIYSNGWASGTQFIDYNGYTTFIYKTIGGGAVTIPVNVGGVWVDSTPYVNVNGVWKEVIVYINVNGTWKETV